MAIPRVNTNINPLEALGQNFWLESPDKTSFFEAICEAVHGKFDELGKWWTKVQTPDPDSAKLFSRAFKKVDYSLDDKEPDLASAKELHGVIRERLRTLTKGKQHFSSLKIKDKRNLIHYLVTAGFKKELKAGTMNQNQLKTKEDAILERIALVEYVEGLRSKAAVMNKQGALITLQPKGTLPKKSVSLLLNYCSLTRQYCKAPEVNARLHKVVKTELHKEIEHLQKVVNSVELCKSSNEYLQEQIEGHIEKEKHAKNKEIRKINLIKGEIAGLKNLIISCNSKIAMHNAALTVGGLSPQTTRHHTKFIQYYTANKTAYTKRLDSKTAELEKCESNLAKLTSDLDNHDKVSTKRGGAGIEALTQEMVDKYDWSTSGWGWSTGLKAKARVLKNWVANGAVKSVRSPYDFMLTGISSPYDLTASAIGGAAIYYGYASASSILPWIPLAVTAARYLLPQIPLECLQPTNRFSNLEQKLIDDTSNEASKAKDYLAALGAVPESN